MDDATREFQRLVGRLDYPLFVVTAAAGEERDGCVVGFTTQCSIDPPLFLVCMSNKNRTFRIAESARLLGVHVLPEERRDLAELLGGETGDETDKLAQVDWREGPGGVPLVGALETWFVGEIKERIELSGDHVGFLLTPVEGNAGEDGDELTFQEAKDIDPGHEP